jgi:hypothetical protein
VRFAPGRGACPSAWRGLAPFAIALGQYLAGLRIDQVDPRADRAGTDQLSLLCR